MSTGLHNMIIIIILHIRNKAQMDQVSTMQHHKANIYSNQDLNLGLLITTRVLYQHIGDFLIKAKPRYKMLTLLDLKMFLFLENCYLLAYVNN